MVWPEVTVGEKSGKGPSDLQTSGGAGPDCDSLVVSLSLLHGKGSGKEYLADLGRACSGLFIQILPSNY